MGAETTFCAISYLLLLQSRRRLACNVAGDEEEATGVLGLAGEGSEEEKTDAAFGHGGCAREFFCGLFCLWRA